MHALREPQHIDHAHHARLHRLHRVVLVMNRRRGTGEVINLIDFEQHRFDHVVANQFEVMIVEQVKYVDSTSGKEVVETNNIVAVSEQPLAKM